MKVLGGTDQWDGFPTHEPIGTKPYENCKGNWLTHCIAPPVDGSRCSWSWCFKQWQANLVEMQPLKKWNCGHHSLLTVIDVLCKYAWVVPVKNKAGTSVTQAFEQVLPQGQKPQCLQTDLGKEFTMLRFVRCWNEKGSHTFQRMGMPKHP